MKDLDFTAIVYFCIIIAITIVVFFIASARVSEIIDGIADVGFLIVLIRSWIRRKYDKQRAIRQIS